MEDSSDSDESSSYGSDREILTSFAKEYSSSSSDDSDRISGVEPIFLACDINEGEKTQILHVISSESVTSDPQIFPGIIKDKLIMKYPHVVSRLKELSDQYSSVIVALGSPLSRTQGAVRVKPLPRGVLLDICVFSPTQPVLILTIASGDEEEKNTKYNSQLTRVLIRTVRQHTKYDISAVHGVIEENLCKTSEKFQEKINRLYCNARVASIAFTLDMTKSKCVDVIQPILKLLSAGSLHTPQRGAEGGKPPVISEANFNAMLKRIEQLEKDSKRKEAKYDHLIDQMEKLKQDYLTDTRLTLLMRPRSSSVSESTVSGYGSIEVDLDGPHRPEHGAIGRETDQTAHTGKTKSTTQPELTTEAIQSGNLELVQYNRNVTLHQACGEGKLEVVKYILSQGVADINCRGKAGRTPVMQAAFKGQVSVFEFLVSQGCDLSRVDNDKDNVLHYACVGGNVDIVRSLLVSEKCDIESRDDSGMTPIMWAARYGQREVFDLLVKKHCDMKVVSKNKNNILHLACIGGCVDIVQYILSHNIVSIDSRGGGGRTPVMTAAEKGHKHVFEYLVKRKCDVKLVDDDKNNILHLACIGGCVDIVQYILSHNIVSIDSRGGGGRTPVMTAAEKGHKHVFEYLVKRKCDVKLVDDDKNNILHAACYGGCVDIVQYILSHNIVSIDSIGVGGRTPVMTAAEKGHKHVFEYLVKRKCDVKLVDDDKNNILHAACYGGCVDIVQYILSHNIVSIDSRGGVGRTPVMTAAEKGHKHVFEYLIERKCDVNLVDDHKDNILHLACYFGHIDIVKHILTHNLVSIESRGQHGMTPVMLAVQRCHTEIFNLLNSKKCNLVARNDNKNNILHQACAGGHVDMVKYLMALRDVKGMEKMENKRGETPVHVAKRKGHVAVVSLFKGRK